MFQPESLQATTPRNLLRRGLEDLQETISEHPQVMNLIEQVFKIQMQTRFHLLININQLVASVVEGATRAS